MLGAEGLGGGRVSYVELGLEIRFIDILVQFINYLINTEPQILTHPQVWQLSFLGKAVYLRNRDSEHCRQPLRVQKTIHLYSSFLSVPITGSRFHRRVYIYSFMYVNVYVFNHVSMQEKITAFSEADKEIRNRSIHGLAEPVIHRYTTVQ